MPCSRVHRCERPFAAAVGWHPWDSEVHWLCDLQPSGTQRVGTLLGVCVDALQSEPQGGFYSCHFFSRNLAAILFVGVTTARDASNSALVEVNAF